MNDIYTVSKNVEKILNGNSTNFLDQKLQIEVKNKLKKGSYKIYKPYKESEKVIYYTNNKPKVLLYEIVSKNKLLHQEIMGTLFSLGIDPSMYGDILIIDNHYYIYILDIIENYLISNFNKIKNDKIELKKIDIDFLSNYEREYEEIELIVSSNRIDTVLSHLIHTSRDKISEKIKNKEILVNYDYPKTSYYLKENDIFSIRRYGKYKYMGVINNTKKDNMVIKILMYR